MAYERWLAEHSATEQMLSAVESGLLSTRRSLNIYSRYQALEKELNVWKEKYTECSRALIEEQNRSERFQRMLLDGRIQKDVYRSGKMPEKKTSSPDSSKTRKVPKRGVLEKDDASVEYRVSWESEEVPCFQKHSLPCEVEADGHTVSAPIKSELSQKGGYEHKSHASSEQVTSSTTSVGTQRIADAADLKRAEVECEEISSKNLISEDLLQKVMQQNTKLKKVLQDIVCAQGLAPQEYLERREYEEIVRQMRLEIGTLHRRTAELQSLTVSSNNELLKQCAQLTNLVHNLEHAAAVRQAMVDVYSTELSKMRLKTQNISGYNQSTETTCQSTASETSQLTRRVIEDMLQLKSKYTEMVNYLRDTITKLKQALLEREQELELMKVKAELQKLALHENDQHKEIQSGTLVSSARSTSCGIEELRLEFTPQSLPQVDLVTDSEPAAYHSKQDAATTASFQEDRRVTGNLVCPRCEKLFSDELLFQTHVKRCTDD